MNETVQTWHYGVLARHWAENNTVDGCDVSGDMLAYCQQAADRAGVPPQLYQQALHQLNLPRQYQTIVACGVFGIGVSREQNFVALQRFYASSCPAAC